MVKILSQSGNSLADVYDVEGSIAGIDQLETRELPIVHEMGHTVFSERLSGSIRRISSGALAQNLTWDIIIADLPVTPTRVFGVACLVDTAGRTVVATVSVRTAVPSGGEREFPIFNFDTTQGTATCRIQDNGAAVANLNLLENGLRAAGPQPSMVIGNEQPQPIDRIAFRGLTAGFGAGTVTVTALIYIGFSQVAGISSRGLPIPGW